MADELDAKVDPSDQEVLIRTFLGRAKDAFQARLTWFHNQLKSQSIRRGILQTVDWPYPGASNPNIPVTDAIVRRKKSGVLNVLAIRPMVQVDVPDEGASPNLGLRLQQWMLDTYDQMRVRRFYEPLVDGWLERSSYFVKVGHKYERTYQSTVIDLDLMTSLDQAMFSAMQQISLPEAFAAAYKMDLADEQDAEEIAKAVKQYEAGKRRIRLKRKVVTADIPDWDVICGEDMIREASAPKDIQAHHWFIHRFKQKVAHIRRKVEDGSYDKAALEMVKNARGADWFGGDGEQAAEQAQEVAEGLAIPQMRGQGSDNQDVDNENVEIETYAMFTWWSPDPEREPARRACFTLFPAYHGGKFVKMEWLDEEYWPFQEFDYDNPSHDTYGGRSVPLMNETLAVEINSLHKSFLDMLPWVSAMAGTYDPDKLVGSSGAAFTLSPGEFAPARGGQALFPVASPRGGAEIVGEANALQSHSENLFGPLQATLNRRQGGGDPTKYEVQTMQGEDNSLQAMEIDSFQESMNFVHQMTMDDMIKNMPPVVRFPFRAPDGSLQHEEVSRDEVQGMKIRVKAHGNLRNANPQDEIQFLLGVINMAPTLVQFGVMPDIRKIAQRIMALHGERNPQEFIPDAPAMPAGGPGGQDPRLAQLMAQMQGGGGASPGRGAPVQAPPQAVPAGAVA